MYFFPSFSPTNNLNKNQEIEFKNYFNTLMHKAFDPVEQHEEYIIVALLIYFSILPKETAFNITESENEPN
jgi:hypothetical protein